MKKTYSLLKPISIFSAKETRLISIELETPETEVYQMAIFEFKLREVASRQLRMISPLNIVTKASQKMRLQLDHITYYYM